MDVETNKRIARQAFEALAGGELGRVAELLGDDAVLHQCGFLQPISAHVILEGRFLNALRLEDRQVQLERLIAEGDIVALHWRTSGRLAGAEPPQRDGVPVSFPSMTFIRLQDGKIVEIWNIQDMATLQSQIDTA